VNILTKWTFLPSENTECNKLFRRIATAGDFVDFHSYVEKTLSRCEFASPQGKKKGSNWK
jgi:hypothetical protein